MSNKQDITVLKRSPRSYRLSMGWCKPLAQGVAGVARCRQPGPEKALKERYQQHMATPCAGNAPLAMKPQRGVIRLISFDYALSGLDRYCDSLVRRALPYAIDYALSGLGVCATFIPQGVARHDCCGDAMHRVSTAHTPYAVDYALSELGVCGTFIPQDVAGIALRSILMSYKLYFFLSLSKIPSGTTY